MHVYMCLCVSPLYVVKIHVSQYSVSGMFSSIPGYEIYHTIDVGLTAPKLLKGFNRVISYVH